ncbi:conserved hypothetical protein [Leishmania infantum JPCM5]|uniref:WD_domain_-_G-beta_repeat_-_putative n=2 Tax=Leishmania infantum TaxID=5671 RepID=A0A6L0XMQ2_LEIIN|nr:conserved hypothetical protein [Leishmania infantum JPCM5]CAC9531583.1 WD_domain_-_G-beta_repeat_-_putative [Leishmania infantum]CAM71289.1 conserved hypothetical protein [Leishmania infantum JPCM5]SUZ45133.1 WD_domain_-_G-beta_repeat_-_putative [Leishmania infantum]|eukprot:XP_001468208.1 conserved hypothetical protein [Leishmania infantum JPCM5]
MPSQQQHSVASELLVNDRILVVPAPPLSIATVGDVVWITFSDGEVEVRNTRTGEVVRRFEPAVSAVPASGPSDSAAVGFLSSVTNRMSAVGVGGATGTSAPLKRHSYKDTATALTVHSAAVVRALLAVPTADGEMHVWMGLSNGCIEVHDGDTFPSRSGETAVGASNRPSTGSLIALLRKHTAAVTSLAEFGGYVYSGSEDHQILQWRACQYMYARFFSSHCPHDGPVRCLYAEGNALVSGSDDCTVKVWDIGEGSMRLTGYFHSQSGGVLALCRVGELMWSGDASGQVVRWHLRTCEAVGIHAPHSGRVLSLCRVGHRVYSGSSDGTMGIFDAASGQLLQRITDQALGWVSAVECPAKLSRFVVWSCSVDGAVRCWYQDEYASMSADEARFDDGSWYDSGSTPYREFRASVGQRTQRLKQQLEAIEHRDNQAMALLRHCSTVFGGSVLEREMQQRRLQDQLAQLGERCRVAEERLATKRSNIAQMDRDIAAALALLQNTRCELNLLIPGEAERVLSSLPAVTTEDLVAYTPTLASAMLGTSATAPSITTTTTDGCAAVAPLPLSSLSCPLPPPTVTVPGSAVAASALPLPLAANTSTLGVGGPLSGVPLPLPPPVAVVPRLGSDGIAVPAPGSAISLQQQPSVPTAGAPVPALTAGIAPAVGTAATVAGVGTGMGAAGAGVDAGAGAAGAGVGTGMGAAGAGVGAGVGAAGAGVGAAGVGVGAGAGVGAGSTGACSAPAGVGADAAAAEKSAGASPYPDDGFRWTNPHVGNYIQRRYYGASPSLRTTDLMKRERRRGRLPRVKVEALQRDRSRSRSPPTALEAKSRSASAKEKRATITTKTATTAVKTSSTKAAT